jgi:hypothetical protein
MHAVEATRLLAQTPPRALALEKDAQSIAERLPKVSFPGMQPTSRPEFVSCDSVPASEMIVVRSSTGIVQITENKAMRRSMTGVGD